MSTVRSSVRSWTYSVVGTPSNSSVYVGSGCSFWYETNALFHRSGPTPPKPRYPTAFHEVASRATGSGSSPAPAGLASV